MCLPILLTNVGDTDVPLPESLSSYQRNDTFDEDVISLSDVDIITPEQKFLARQLTCDIVPRKSLLVTG